MEIIVSHNISITPFKSGDDTQLQAKFNSKDVLSQLLEVPNPYTLDAAREWIYANLKHAKEKNEHLNLVIRMDEALIGGIGQKPGIGENFNHSTEIGYWLSKEFWGKGIMTKVVSAYANWLVKEKGYQRVTAIPFEHNLASQRVLEKSGFKLEGILNKFVLKNGEYINCKLFAYLV